MSNDLAVATATAALRQLLLPAVQVAVPGADVTLARPHAIAADANGAEIPGVNLYLYQVTPNAALRNADLPTRASSGSAVQRPATGWDLHYLLTFYGSTTALEPERLLGKVIKTLHSRPQLDRELIQNLIASGSYPELASSDLQQAVDLVRFRPIVLSLEELSRLWAVFPQTPYSLSAAYVGSVVVIEADAAPAPALPVRERAIFVETFRQPTVDSVAVDGVANAPLTATGTLVVHGRQLQGEDIAQLRLGQTQITPSPIDGGGLQVDLATVPAAGLRAGVQPLQVVLLRRTATGTQPAGESNAVAVTLVPQVSGVQFTTPSGVPTVSFDVLPPIAAGQRVSLLLNGIGAGAGTFSLAIPASASAISHLDVPLAGVAAGDYLLRLRVDSATSLLQADGSGAYVSPKVSVA